MSMFVPNLLSPLSRFLSTSNAVRVRHAGTPRRILPAVPWLLWILLVAPKVFAVGSEFDGPRVAAVPCAAGSVLVPSASFSSTTIQGPTILDLEGSGILELEISTLASEEAVGHLTVSPCSSTTDNDPAGVDLPGLVLSAESTQRTVWIQRPGRWSLTWSGPRQGFTRPALLRTRWIPWRELGEIDLLGPSVDPSVAPASDEVALLSRWTPTIPEVSFDKEEDHEVDPDPSTAGPNQGSQGRSDLFLLQLGRRVGSGDLEPLGWVLFLARDESAQGDTAVLSTKEEDHEVDPDPSTLFPLPTDASTLWNAWVVPAKDGEALWLQWREATPSNVESTNATGSRIASRALDLTHWLDPVVDSERTLSVVPTRVLPWHLGPSILGARR